jgi:hypothetical protein
MTDLSSKRVLIVGRAAVQSVAAQIDQRIDPIVLRCARPR